MFRYTDRKSVTEAEESCTVHLIKLPWALNGVHGVHGWNRRQEAAGQPQPIGRLV
jgi:hypothetical protein